MKIILGSQSPRRQELLAKLDIDFEVRVQETDELFPADMPLRQVAQYLAQMKAQVQSVAPDEVLLTADTTVLLGEQILNKPADADEAIAMLTLLSGKTHEVVTGVCLKTLHKTIAFSDSTLVEFLPLTPAEIQTYVHRYMPLDKAGAYGVQEWIGLVGIRKMIGSYFTVMGLPVHLVYQELKELGAV
jgi:septum formation protein